MCAGSLSSGIRRSADGVATEGGCVKTKLCLLTLLACCTSAHAIALMEAERMRAIVHYGDSASVEAVCRKQGPCHLNVKLAGKTYRITEQMLPADVEIIPSNLYLTYTQGHPNPTVYSVGFEIVCDEYAERPPVHICLASVNMHGSKVAGFSMIKRTYTDEAVRTYRARKKSERLTAYTCHHRGDR